MLFLSSVRAYDSLSLMFFFFKQKTAYEMRISDWSSDVCSSDLHRALFLGRHSRKRHLAFTCATSKMTMMPHAMNAITSSTKTGKRTGNAKPRYRTIWISDVHLGTPDCKASHLVDFLKQNDCETLYLVGDIIDGWRLRSGWFWPQEHTNVVRKILTKARSEEHTSELQSLMRTSYA